MRTRIRASVPSDVVIVFAAFAAMGIPGSMSSVAWPTVRQTFGLPLDALGALLIASTVGSVASNLVSGRLQARLGLGLYLTFGSAGAVAGMVGYALAPAWWVMVSWLVVASAGYGAINAGLNTYLATHYSTRVMTWVHACFGLGATTGPWLMTALPAAGHSWRWGYAISAVVQGVFTVTFALTRNQWRMADRRPGAASGAKVVEAASWRETARLPLLWVGIAMLGSSNGTQATAGQWTYTLFTEGRGIDAAIAGVWSGLYWASITVGRVAVGIVGDRVPIATILRVCTAGLIAGAALIWWNPAAPVSFLGLAMMGLFIAPMYPLLVLLMPRLVGVEHVANAIGFQIAAGSVTVALTPALAGVLAERISLEVIGPFLLFTTTLLLGAHEISRRVMAKRAAAGAPAPAGDSR